MSELKRKLIAVGDLHGDYYRLIRVLSEEKFLDPKKITWTEEASRADIILLGDYVDWRREPLEGPKEEWPQGPRRLIELIHKLYTEHQERSKDKSFHGRFFPLTGNHDQMMIESFDLIEELGQKSPETLEKTEDIGEIVNQLGFEASDPKNAESLMRILNWYEQGGHETIVSFGGLQGWRKAMKSPLGEFLRKLPVAVVINKKLFCHSVPDTKELWTPIPEGKPVYEESKETRDQYLWGRKVWGYDAFRGKATKPFTEKEIDEMLDAFGVNAVVIGHTTLHQKQPYLHFGGKVINLDMHGIPGSKPFIEEYEAAP